MASCISIFISCANYSIILFNYVYCVSRTSYIRDDARRSFNSGLYTVCWKNYGIHTITVQKFILFNVCPFDIDIYSTEHECVKRLLEIYRQIYSENFVTIVRLIGMSSRQVLFRGILN